MKTALVILTVFFIVGCSKINYNGKEWDSTDSIGTHCMAEGTHVVCTETVYLERKISEYDCKN